MIVQLTLRERVLVVVNAGRHLRGAPLWKCWLGWPVICLAMLAVAAVHGVQRLIFRKAIRE